MRLFEFLSNSSTLLSVMKVIHSSHKLERVGGNSRFYQIDDGYGVVYLLDGGPKAIGLKVDKSLNSVSQVFVWNEFNLFESPDYVTDLPQEAMSVDQYKDSLLKFIANPASRLFENLMEARQVTPEEFKTMAIELLGPDGAANMSLVQLNQVAMDNDVKIPGAIRSDRSLKVDAHHWNLTGISVDKTKERLGQALGGEIEDDPNKNLDPDYLRQVELSKVKSLNDLSSKNKLYLMGRNAKNRFFRIPGTDKILAQLERMLNNQLDVGQGVSMEQQYEQLKERVELVAGGKSNFIKSLLITGSPSSGKTFSVMDSVKKLGLKEGDDYVVKKGHITTKSLYRVLIEQIDGLAIFDDCDSVVDEKSAINMLKGALDTDPIRQISYDAQGAINTAVMSEDDRKEYVDSISRILRGEPREEDFERHSMVTRGTITAKKSKNDDDDDDAFDIDDNDFLSSDEQDAKAASRAMDLHVLQNYFSRKLPNKIDFRGRIIFISNMTEDEWDSAILTRAFHVDMNFTDVEMLDYIDTIKHHIKTPGLSDEDKDEVMAYIREMWTSGRIKRAINFRFVQACFDLKFTSQWKEMIALL